MAEFAGFPVAARPEDLGFDSGRLARLDDYMAGMVEAGRVAGVSTLILRHGKVAAHRTHGSAVLGGASPLSFDAVFRIYSMTKPIAATAMMILFEEGHWVLDDPITKFVPEFTALKVCAGVGPDGEMILEDARRPPTMREVMSHTAGFAYGVLKAVRKRYVGKEYQALAIKALKGVIANIDEAGELQQVSFGTPVFDTIQGYKDIPLTSMPYGQSLAMLALGEFQRAFI